MKIIHRIIAAACLAMALAAYPLNASAQGQDSQTSSPFSMKGYGLLNDRASSAQRAMGSVGYAMRDSRQINVMNPASYSAIDTMTFLFDIGANVGMYRSKEGLAKGKNTLGGLDYVTLQVPIGRIMGASVGLLPFSSVGYSFGDKIPNGESAYQGSGGITEAYLGFSIRPVGGLSLGFNAGYLFGNEFNDIYSVNDQGSQSLYERVLKVRDYNLQFGLQYSQEFARKHRLTLGLAYTLGHDLHGETYGVKYDIATEASKPDTIGFRHLRGGYSLPHTFGAGLSYEFDKKLFVEADFTWQPWSKARFAGVEDFTAPESFNDRWRAAIGAQYQSRQRGSWLRRVAYRIGAYCERDYQMIGSSDVRQYGLTCGFGLPTPLRTRVNIGFEWKHRYSSPATSITENYYMFTLGVNLSENWFVPSKIR